MMKKLSVSASLVLFACTSYADVDAPRQAELRHLLLQDCGSCHGMTLKGGLGPALLPENLRDKSTDFIVSTILDGREGTAMPGWKTMLNKDDADWIAQQLLAGVK
jgi:cytochrome c55X